MVMRARATPPTVKTPTVRNGRGRCSPLRRACSSPRWRCAPEMRSPTASAAYPQPRSTYGQAATSSTSGARRPTPSAPTLAASADRHHASQVRSAAIEVRRAWSSSAGEICSTGGCCAGSGASAAGGGEDAMPSPAGPVGGEHRVEDAVEHAAPDALHLAQGALLAEPEALGDRAAARVLDRRLDEDAIEAPRREGVIDVGADGLGHRPAPLLVAGQPVADARLAVGPVDAVGADHPHHPPVAGDDRGLQPVVDRKSVV